ncbi:hypothetical protein FK220_009735 [Flavobacteriaceae bacterium TP-CH-4]|uniref:Uncharacterized protein n=1 Tax=Pelagihabitans pacificus TaxID=2696054 RepID=A0A967B001_9FLAO|nr:hypothetical protein [Pelagihabitans pacificus]NHF59621.1 hypothetical protein [Pelagihabitans pacificus]
MKRIMFMVLILLFAGCKGQEESELEKAEVKKDSTEIPEGQWEVKKEYDEFGNLIRYDSIYSYSYSNPNGESLKINLDSIMDSFRSYFDQEAPLSRNGFFPSFPRKDSLFMKDFFEEDYFFKNWERHHSDMEGIIKQMDSLRNAFLKKYHPGLMESQEEGQR